MAYQIYTTPALVCGSFDRNTSDRFYYLFTRDAGMILAHAKSVREERSKHRFALQDFSLVDVSLVRGRNGWKVTGSASRGNWYYQNDDRTVRAALLSITNLLRRLVQGEERHDALFSCVTESLAHFLKTGTFDARIFEELLTLKMLHLLGYVAPTPQLAPILHTSDISAAYDAYARAEGARHHATKSIEEALYVAQL